MTVDIPCIGMVSLVNMHATAGGVTHPENPGVDTDREDELRQAIECLSPKRNEMDVGTYAGGIIVGDLNCGPEASPGNYEYVILNGFRDAYTEAEAAGGLLEGPEYSWDPTNYLNKIGPHAECPGQRCDHVFVQRDCLLDEWKAHSAQLVFAEQFVDIKHKDGVKSTLSDHHGLVVELRRPKKSDSAST
eukprot:CAMPEP_0185027924 /NCGR_PEP_ID=MMETSP1103-20130426/13265_1 /TAXON_ID=36769 /ORGANISM="Paraphysomonas bandaiensis, Strain Caron Lab Isolate" /LENGTH=188 /DNA_ID=CAMNT_0027562121 /DNA_START=382 /DNA_END=948 /DNA_ORIENTATION=+